MKNVANLLFVLFLLVGIGFVYAGKGVCVKPETTYRYFTKFYYYPQSGCLSIVEYHTVVGYPDMDCEGEEGSCTLIQGIGIYMTGSITIDYITYYEGVDNMIKDQGTWGPFEFFGRKVC